MLATGAHSDTTGWLVEQGTWSSRLELLVYCVSEPVRFGAPETFNLKRRSAKDISHSPPPPDSLLFGPISLLPVRRRHYVTGGGSRETQSPSTAAGGSPRYRQLWPILAAAAE
ncbi:hypothetical protein C8035_v009870 [Colletotrichum spinosum]|uniref:Uncharacterized protein n=1 Tax=Colletotrichum spinosum TaxID=1347390 RepID=A0A4R8PV55_9PEZI|nr:hypothetical protein C8035_v009870 [Colletotrichum spinosum]